MRKFLLLFSLMLLAIISAKAEVVTFIAQGVTEDITSEKVTIANSTDNNIIGQTFTKDGVCSLAWTKFNSAYSNVTSSLVRWYQDDVLTIDCLAGIVINKVVIKASSSNYAKAAITTVIDGAEDDAFDFPTYTNTTGPFLRTWEGECTSKMQLKAGAQVRFSYIEITYTPGTGVEVAAPVIAYGEVANTVALSTETEGASIYYTLDGTEPSAASTLYSAPFAISAVTEVKAVAVNGSASSAVASATMRLNKVNDLAAFVANANSSETLVATPVTAIYQNGRYLYIKDAKDNYLLAYNDKDLESVTGQFTTNGDVISEISGTFKSQNGVPEILVTSVGGKSAGEEVEPYEVNVADITTNMVNQYVTFGPVSIVAATAANNFTATDEDGNAVTLYKQFNNAAYNTVVEIPEGEGFMVTGFVSIYSGKVQIIPVAFSEGTVMETVATPVFTPASGALNAGDLITIECATEGAKIYYTTEDENPSATSVTSILYDGAISFSENMTIKAIAVKDGMIDSEIATASYTLIVAGETEVTYDFTSITGVGVCSDSNIAPAKTTTKEGTNNLDAVSFAKEDVVLTFATNGATTTARWWETTTPSYELRTYANNQLTFTVPDGYKLVSVTAIEGNVKFTATVGSMDSTGYVWTAPEEENVTSVTLTAGKGSLKGFTVKYVSTGLSAIEEIEVDANAPVEFYNLQGVRVAADAVAPGIYVVRQGSKAMKVLVK